MIKQFLGISFSAGLILLAGCTRPIQQEQRNSSLPVTNTAPINLDAAVAQAGAEHKMVLLDFTGTDWCQPCMQLHEDVFAKPEFQAYAQTNLVFLSVDFPMKYQLSPEASATNDWLSQKFGVYGFPTLVALDGHGNKIWQQAGVESIGSPKEWIAKLDEVKAKTK